MDKRGPDRFERLQHPVISVGNLTVGGTGKTPFTEACARLLQDAGLRVAVLSRGYGRTGKGPRMVSEGNGLLVPWHVAGDEPALLARRLPGLIVAVGERRAEVGRILDARSDLGVDVYLLDDGFQHRRLARDLDFVLVRGDAPFGNGRLLPAGPLREPAEGLARASAVVVTSRPEESSPEVELLLREHLPPDRPVLYAEYVADGLRTLSDEPAGPASALRDHPVAALSGIAQPNSFLEMLRRTGTRIVHHRSFRDHHAYTREEMDAFCRAAREAGAETVVTTEKDAVRIDGLPLPAKPPLRSLAVTLTPLEPDRLRAFLLEAAGRSGN